MLLIVLVVGIALLGTAMPFQSTAPLTNDDVISLKKAGLSDEVILLKINSGPTKFKTDPADMVALKNAGVSDALIAAILKAAAPAGAVNAAVAKSGPVDLSMIAVIKPFESSITDSDAAGLPDSTRTAVIQILKNKQMFSALLSPEEAAGKRTMVEISAELVDFAPGNAATRLMIGLGTGRAHAGFAFTVKDSATGKVLWKKPLKRLHLFGRTPPPPHNDLNSPRRSLKRSPRSCKKLRFPYWLGEWSGRFKDSVGALIAI